MASKKKVVKKETPPEPAPVPVAATGNRASRRAKETTPPKQAMELASTKTNFTMEEALNLQEMQRTCNIFGYVAKQVAGNTALVPRGQEFAKELDAVARLVENTKAQWVSQKLREHGWGTDEIVSVNLSTGEVVLTGPAQAALQ